MLSSGNCNFWVGVRGIPGFSDFEGFSSGLDILENQCWARNSADIPTSCLKDRSEDVWFLDIPSPPSRCQRAVVPIPPAAHRISGAWTKLSGSSKTSTSGCPQIGNIPASGMFHDHVRQWKPMSSFAGDQSYSLFRLPATPSPTPWLTEPTFHDLPFTVHDAPAPSLVLQFLVGHDPRERNWGHDLKWWALPFGALLWGKIPKGLIGKFVQTWAQLDKPCLVPGLQKGNCAGTKACRTTAVDPLRTTPGTLGPSPCFFFCWILVRQWLTGAFHAWNGMGMGEWDDH